MPKRSITLHNDFTRNISTLDRTRCNFEKACNVNIISNLDIIQAYAGLYLELFTEFENLLENLFVGLLSGSVYHSDTSVFRKIKIKPVNVIELVLQGEKRTYLDWLPYAETTIKRANIYFSDGKPFSQLSDVQKGKIKTYHKIRNAIAHKGKKSETEFQKIIAGSTLSPIEKTPSGYLRNIPNRAWGYTQLQIISNELTAISHRLCA